MSTVEQVKAPGESGGISGWWSNSRAFLTEVRNEMRRVTWPTRREVYATTFVVVITAMFFGMPMALFPALAERYGGGAVGPWHAGARAHRARTRESPRPGGEVLWPGAPCADVTRGDGRFSPRTLGAGEGSCA